MNVERWVYLTALEDIASKADRALALDLQKEWSINAKNQNMAQAACDYISDFVLPSLSGNPSRAVIPAWIDEQLFHPIECPTDIPSFMRLFKSNYAEALNERQRGTGEPVPAGNVDWTETVDCAKRGNFGLYFTPNPIDGLEVSEKGSRRLDANIKRFSAVFADFDGGDKADQLLRIAFAPKPSMMVESKNGYHAYWMLKDSPTLEVWKALQNAVIEQFGSDKAVRNPSRLMRLPFTWHMKGDPFWVTVFSFDWKLYTSQELVTSLGVKFAPPRAFERKVDPMYVRGLKEPSETVLGAGVRHPTLEEEAGRTYAGISLLDAQRARDVIKLWYSRSCQPLKPDWEREANQYCDWIERRQFGSVISQ